VEIFLTKGTWDAARPTLEQLFLKIVEGWKTKISSKEDRENGQQEGAGDSQ